MSRYATASTIRVRPSLFSGCSGVRYSSLNPDPVEAVLIFFLGLLGLLPGNSPGTSVCGEMERLIGGGGGGGGGAGAGAGGGGALILSTPY